MQVMLRPIRDPGHTPWRGSDTLPTVQLEFEMKGPRSTLMGWLGGLRFPVLLVITTALLIVNVFVPDAFPFVDEILLGLIAILLSRIKKGRESRDIREP